MAASPWSLYEYRPSFVIAFHGCDAAVGEAILAGHSRHLKRSKEKWDWLGHGTYFWEGNPQRALDWARRRHREGKIETPFVIGAVLDLGHCLDLLDSSGLQEVKDAHAVLAASYDRVGQPLPRNVGADQGARILDCLVINSLHDYRRQNRLVPYDSVRAMFPEGEALYAGAGFRDKNHVQICVRSLKSVKAYFRPIRAR